VSAGGKLFITQYTNNTNDFGRGNIFSFGLDAGGNPDATAQWEAATQLTQLTSADRVIITNNGGVGKPFQWDLADLSLAQEATLNADGSNHVDSKGQERLNFLRGDRSQEGILFRKRHASQGLLGDIINSTPWYVAAPTGAYPDVLYPGFSAYLDANLGRREVVYVGANDGLLHGFDAKTGAEVLGFIPNAVYRNLSKLTDPGYTSRTFVDGAIFAGDADVNGWKTFLIGTTGRGAQSIFALDVTHPDSFSEGNAGSIFKWEFSDQDDADLGNIIGSPTTYAQKNSPQQIVKMNNGKWAVIIGNGYNSASNSDSKGVPDNNVSASGGAALYVLFMDGPSGPGNTWLPTPVNGATGNYVKISLYDPGCGTTLPLSDDRCRGYGPDNGLGTVTPFDLNNDGKVDVLYAADLKGNVWKVDVTGSPGTWINKYSRLYSAAVNVTSPAPAHLVAQPITTSVTAVGHPFGGVIVNFITGKSLATTDLNDSLQQTLYGIWDRPLPLPSGVTYPPSSDRSRLQQQQIGVAFNGNGRGGFSSEIDWTTKDGWYYDLPALNEKGIFNPFLNENDVLVFDTLFTESNNQICSAETSTYLNLLDAVDGRAPDINLDIGKDEAIFANDKISVSNGKGGTVLVSSSGVKIAGGVSGSTRVANVKTSTGPPTKEKNGTDCLDGFLSSLGNGGLGKTLANCSTNTGRIYWREITRDAQ
jgi:type IV pilus assembly protein PilY1